jgi:hypothetical protein
MSTPAEYLNPGLAGYGIYQGATSSNPLAQARAAASAAKLGNNLYNNFGNSGGTPSSVSNDINTGATGALDALGVYQGLEQGGWQGDTKAGASALQGAGLLTGDSALSTIGGGLLIPLDLYNEINNYQSGNTGADAMSGAETGAAIGSVIPGLGTAIGGVIGGAAGALASAFGPGEKDPETSEVQNVINATSSNQNNPGVAASVQDPYTALAGLMDERSSTLPEYAQYGRMGEQNFTNAMVDQINQAVKADPSLAQNPTAVYNQVVAPWVNSMGSGYSNVGQAYTATNQGLLEDMTNQYLSGDAAQDWKAVGGDSPFANIYQNSPITAAPTPVAQPAPTMGRVDASLRTAAKGGPVTDLNKRLHDLYQGSFANRPRQFSVGGYNNYVQYLNNDNSNTSNLFSPGSTYSTFNNQDIYPATETPSAPVDTSNLITGGEGDVNASAGSTGGGGSSSNSNSILGSGGALSGLGSALGVSSMGQLIQQYGALAPLLAAALGGNKPASAPATPSGYGAIPSIATPNISRAYTQPNVANWYTYGEGPEQSFFSNNQLPNIPGVSPAQSTSPSASSSMAPSAPVTVSAPPGTTSNPTATPRPELQAQGGTFDSAQGDSYVSDPGHGDGTSDDVNAKLSGGEYVMDGGTVSMLGNGSNEAGARALDQLRQRIRKHAGKQLVKGKQFMKAKSPENYLGGNNS